jgi:hypothetical protein
MSKSYGGVEFEHLDWSVVGSRFLHEIKLQRRDLSDDAIEWFGVMEGLKVPYLFQVVGR